MILVDTSVWVDHLRAGEEILVNLLDSGRVLSHPFVVGEIALGNVRQRHVVLEALLRLPRATVASNEEVMLLIEQSKLFGLGIGYLDAHLLAAVRLTPGASLWTRDRRLHAVAGRLDLAMQGS